MASAASRAGDMETVEECLFDAARQLGIAGMM